MKNRSFCSLWERGRAIELSAAAWWFAVVCAVALGLPARTHPQETLRRGCTR